MWTAQFFKFDKPRTLITSGGLGTMGFGFPAAIGAQVAFPEKTVIDIAGDGSFQMNVQELATAVQYNLPVKMAILNNHCLGMVRQWQQLFCNQRYSQTLFEVAPDFVKLAEAYGAVGLRATKSEEVEAGHPGSPFRPPAGGDGLRDRPERMRLPHGPGGRSPDGNAAGVEKDMRHVISVLVDNEPGVLSRISGLFSGRGFNIESLNVAETLDPTISRMTLVTSGNEQIIEQIIKQLNKLVNVIKVYRPDRVRLRGTGDGLDPGQCRNLLPG